MIATAGGNLKLKEIVKMKNANRLCIVFFLLLGQFGCTKPSVAKITTLQAPNGAGYYLIAMEEKREARFPFLLKADCKMLLDRLAEAQRGPHHGEPKVLISFGGVKTYAGSEVAYGFAPGTTAGPVGLLFRTRRTMQLPVDEVFYELDPARLTLFREQLESIQAKLKK